jgi:3-dehydroquinate dehydratase-2
MGSARNRIEVLHGVNLDMLGKRDPEHYGTLTLIELEVRIRHWARQLGLEVSFFQTNAEGEYVERLHQAPQIRDALEITDLPTVEVHLSDIDAREDWRGRSVIAELAIGRIAGKGPEGYHDALDLIATELGVTPPAAA